MKIQVALPVDHSPELNYVVDILFGEVLGVEYEVETRMAITDVLILVGERRLIFQDHFFSKLIDGEDYQQEKNLPPKVRFLEHAEKQIPIIYGHNYFHRDEKMIVCGLDVFASVFFLLTAWEEDARPQIFEEHGSFPFNATWIWKSRLHQEDILSIYKVLLVDLLAELGIEVPDKTEEPKRELYVVVEDLQHFKQGYIPPTTMDFVRSPQKAFQEQKKWKKYRETGKDPWNNLEDWKKYAMQKGFELSLLISSKLTDKQRAEVQGFAADNDLSCGFYAAKGQSALLEPQKSPITLVQANWTLQEKWRYLQIKEATTSLNAALYGIDGYRCGTSSVFPSFDIASRKVNEIRELPLWSMEREADQEQNSPLSNVEATSSNMFRLCVRNQNLPD